MLVAKIIVWYIKIALIEYFSLPNHELYLIKKGILFFCVGTVCPVDENTQTNLQDWNNLKNKVVDWNNLIF